MSDDYLWDKSGSPDLDTKQLEELLAPLAHDAPLDELRLAKGRRGEPVRATAQEPVTAPPESGRAKGKMNIFDKRIIGAATLTAAALGLLGVTAYMRGAGHTVSRSVFPLRDQPYRSPEVDLGLSFADTPRFAPVAPTTGADLAITAGESAWIHVPIGSVDIEIQSSCNAEVELSMATAVRFKRPAHAGDPLKVETESGGGMLVVGTDRPDGRASTYHLVPGLDPGLGMYEYTSRCIGQSPIRGHLVIDRVDISEPIGTITNARVYGGLGEYSARVFGSVRPGAKVFIGAKPIALGPPDTTVGDPPDYPTFAIVVPERRVAAVRVDDVKGTHFYVMHSSSMEVVPSCAVAVSYPKQKAKELDAQGDHAGALRTMLPPLANCKADRETLSLVLEYACKAGDVAAARKYWRQLPPELQRTLEPVCAQNAITRDALDRP